MTDATQRRGARRIFSSTLFLSGLCLAAILVGIGFARSYYQDYKIRQEIGAMEQKIGTLKQKNIASLELLSYVMSKDFVEEKARTELNMKKSGEHVLVAANRTDDRSAGGQPQRSAGQTNGNPLQWWYYFFGEHGETP